MTGLPVYSRWINPKGPESAAGGEVNAPVAVGGYTVAPGDLVIGDGTASPRWGRSCWRG